MKRILIVTIILLVAFAQMASADGTITWTGTGLDATPLEECDDDDYTGSGNGYIHWILSPAASGVTAAYIQVGEGAQWVPMEPDKISGTSRHFFTEPAYSKEVLQDMADKGQIRVQYEGEVGTTNPLTVVKISHYCPGIPEFPTVALPIAAIIGLAFFFQRRKE